MQDNTNFFSKMFAEIVTNEYNQHITMITVGDTGGGKSSANLRLAYDTSLHMAKIKGGKPEDYFDIEKNCAIITQDEILRCMQHTGKYKITLLDDIGVGWNSRDWQKESNKIMNNIFQTFRTDNSILLMTLPNRGFIDKVPRTLVKYYMEMQGSKYFKSGYSVGKLFKLEMMHRLDKTYHKYLHDENNNTIKRVAFKRPPQHIVDAYEVKRTAIAEQLKKQGMEAFEQLMNKSEEKAEGKMNKKDMYFDTVFNLKKEGYSYPEISKIVGISQSYAHTILKKNGVSF